MYFVENDVNDESDRSMNIEIDKGKKKRWKIGIFRRCVP